ncbi:MAG: TlpA family protein disulfide reductase [Rikenellaceae bacterium]|nr:TlpA family protein disulfide reductase [Rikenellaceae bacterium]
MLMVVAAVSIICFEASAQGATARISGTISAAYDGAVTLQYGDAERLSLRLDAHCRGGRFEVEVPVERASEVALCAGSVVLARLIIAPDQTLLVEYADGESAFSGSAGAINEQLNNYLKKMQFRSFTPSYSAASAAQFVEILDRNIEIERGRMLRELSDAPQLLREWAEAEIRYRNAGYAVEYLYRNRLTDSVSMATMYDRVRFPIDGAGALCSDYSGYLSNLVRDRYIDGNQQVVKLRAQRNYVGAYVAALERVAQCEQCPEERDVIGAIVLDMAFNEPRSTFAEMLELIHDRQLVGDEVIERFDAKRHGRADMRRFTEHTFERLLAESHSKVIYVDTWATWCAPCRRELKHLRRMEKRLENEPIKFVSLCVSSPYAQWSLLTDLPENRAANYWLDDEAQAVLDCYIRIRSFPRFFVLSGGQIVNDNIQWPSSNDLIDGLLRGYVEELNKSTNE